jgi:hypothetical protein
MPCLKKDKSLKKIRNYCTFLLAIKGTNEFGFSRAMFAGNMRAQIPGGVYYSGFT